MKKLTTWNNGPNKRCSLLDENETVISVGIEEANAQRIVACVNMAEGVPTEQLNIIDLQGLIKAHDSVLDLLEIAIAERDKERAVKETQRKRIEHLETELCEAVMDVLALEKQLGIGAFESLTKAEGSNNDN